MRKSIEKFPGAMGNTKKGTYFISLFETVWKQSLPAQEVFGKLEKSIPPEVNSQMQQDEAMRLLFNLITNSKYRVDIGIPTNTSYQLLVSEGLGNCLYTSINQGVKIRILLPIDLRNNLNITNPKIEAKQVEHIQARRIMLIVDNCHSLVLEINEASGGALKSIIKNAVYSTSSVALMTSSVLFEKMWI